MQSEEDPGREFQSTHIDVTVLAEVKHGFQRLVLHGGEMLEKAGDEHGRQTLLVRIPFHCCQNVLVLLLVLK